MEKSEKKGINISARSFVTSILVILALMILTYALTFIIPAGEYARTVNANGDSIIDLSSEFRYVEGGLPFWKWLLSPFLVLGAEGGGTTIAVIAFLLVIGGVFNSLDHCGLMKYMLELIVHKFGKHRYKLMAIIILFFMCMGAFIGSFEECVPLVPIVVALAISLGWDPLTGLGMSILAAGCGFSSGICNPFTVGVAQELAGLPMFSGIWLRIIGFVLIYALLFAFLHHHAKKHAKPLEDALAEHSFRKDPDMNKAFGIFAVILGIGILTVLCSSFLTFLQDYTMIIVALMFLIAGITAVLTAKMTARELLKTFLSGILSILPAVLMILMAASIKYTLVEAKILDTLLHSAMVATATLPKWCVILFIYLIVLVMNFFIASGSAKAFLLIPLIAPIAQAFGISPQLSVLAFAFGDGFSNVFYPTNPVLLISLGLADTSYGKWVKWSVKFQLANLILTSLLLLFGLAVGYA
ncbi:MAG: YfcC family protein [Christensenellaceae bacterium]|nr:YfcC family protein [Christensenellaceae bacterium]